MIDYLDSPVPYIIGINRKLWKEMKLKRKLISKDVAIFDVDKRVFKNVDTGLLELPKKILETAYNEIIEILHKPIDAWIKKTAEVRMSFLKLNLKLIANFRKYYLDNNKDKGKFDSIFNMKEFLNNSEPESTDFLKEFAKSECFILFIESMNNPNTSDLLRLQVLSNAIENNDDSIFQETLKIIIDIANHVNMNNIIASAYFNR